MFADRASFILDVQAAVDAAFRASELGDDPSNSGQKTWFLDSGPIPPPLSPASSDAELAKSGVAAFRLYGPKVEGLQVLTSGQGPGATTKVRLWLEVGATLFPAIFCPFSSGDQMHARFAIDANFDADGFCSLAMSSFDRNAWCFRGYGFDGLSHEFTWKDLGFAAIQAGLAPDSPSVTARMAGLFGLLVSLAAQSANILALGKTPPSPLAIPSPSPSPSPADLAAAQAAWDTLRNIASSMAGLSNFWVTLRNGGGSSSLGSALTMDFSAELQLEADAFNAVVAGAGAPTALLLGPKLASLEAGKNAGSFFLRGAIAWAPQANFSVESMGKSASFYAAKESRQGLAAVLNGTQDLAVLENASLTKLANPSAAKFPDKKAGPAATDWAGMSGGGTDFPAPAIPAAAAGWAVAFAASGQTLQVDCPDAVASGLATWAVASQVNGRLARPELTFLGQQLRLGKVVWSVGKDSSMAGFTIGFGPQLPEPANELPYLSNTILMSGTLAVTQIGIGDEQISVTAALTTLSLHVPTLMTIGGLLTDTGMANLTGALLQEAADLLKVIPVVGGIAPTVLKQFGSTIQIVPAPPNLFQNDGILAQLDKVLESLLASFTPQGAPLSLANLAVGILAEFGGPIGDALNTAVAGQTITAPIPANPFTKAVQLAKLPNIFRFTALLPHWTLGQPALGQLPAPFAFNKVGAASFVTETGPKYNAITKQGNLYKVETKAYAVAIGNWAEIPSGCGIVPIDAGGWRQTARNVSITGNIKPGLLGCPGAVALSDGLQLPTVNLPNALLGEAPQPLPEGGLTAGARPGSIDFAPAAMKLKYFAPVYGYLELLDILNKYQTFAPWQSKSWKPGLQTDVDAVLAALHQSAGLPLPPAAEGNAQLLDCTVVLKASWQCLLGNILEQSTAVLFGLLAQLVEKKLMQPKMSGALMGTFVNLRGSLGTTARPIDGEALWEFSPMLLQTGWSFAKNLAVEEIEAKGFIPAKGAGDAGEIPGLDWASFEAATASGPGQPPPSVPTDRRRQ